MILDIRQHCYAVLTSSANAATQLVLRTQAERKAATLRIRRMIGV